MTLVQVLFTIILKVAISLFYVENVIYYIFLTETVTPSMLGLKKKKNRKTCILLSVGSTVL